MEASKYDFLKQRLTEHNIEFYSDAPMSKYTSFQIGGPCPVLIEPKSEPEVQNAVKACHESGCDFIVIGNGSNLLAPDEGIGSAAIRIAQKFSDVTVKGDRITAQAGASLSKACKAALDAGLSGLEFAWGIPGTVGGAAYMNAGAYGGEMQDVIASCAHVLKDGSHGVFDREQLDFGYRCTAYMKTDAIITTVDFLLTPGDRDEIKARMDDYMFRRKDKQPLEFPSAGSVFKRPQGNFAGALIEQCGLKGISAGGAQVSEKHAGFIINRGGATCGDVKDLIELIKRTVKEKTGYELECEVRFLK